MGAGHFSRALTLAEQDRHSTAGKVWEQPLCHAGVVVDHMSFCELGPGVKHLVEVCEHKMAPGASRACKHLGTESPIIELILKPR
jgi:hypothetical protein